MHAPPKGCCCVLCAFLPGRVCVRVCERSCWEYQCACERVWCTGLERGWDRVAKTQGFEVWGLVCRPLCARSCCTLGCPCVCVCAQLRGQVLLCSVSPAGTVGVRNPFLPAQPPQLLASAVSCVSGRRVDTPPAVAPAACCCHSRTAHTALFVCPGSRELRGPAAVACQPHALSPYSVLFCATLSATLLSSCATLLCHTAH